MFYGSVSPVSNDGVMNLSITASITSFEAGREDADQAAKWQQMLKEFPADETK